MLPIDPAAGQARAAFARRAWSIAARVAAVMLALYLTAPLLVADATFRGFASPIPAIVTGVIILAGCAVMVLLARHNRALVADVAWLEVRAEELGDRNWEL